MNPHYAFVARRAGHRCEYCHAPEAIFNLAFEVEHIIPVSQQEIDAETNLALACRSCNIHKADRIDILDDVTGGKARLFNPRLDSWQSALCHGEGNGFVGGIHGDWSRNRRVSTDEQPVAASGKTSLDKSGSVSIARASYTPRPKENSAMAKSSSKISCNLFAPGLALALFLLAIPGCRSITQPKPSWTKAKLLSEKEDHPSKIVSDGNNVFFVTGGTIASKNEGTNNIKRVSLKDGTVSVLVKGGERIPDSTLAVDEEYLYWSDGGNIMRVPKEGGESEKIIAGTPKPDEMVMDDENIYWLIWGGEGSPPLPLMVAPKKGGVAKQLTPAQSPTSGLSIDGSFIYWMTGDGIRRIAKTGGEITAVYRNPSKQPSLGLQQDADSFYFCQMDSKGHSALMKLGKQSGEVTQLVPSINHTQDFVVDDHNVYYFDEIPGTGSFGPIALKKVPKAGGNPLVLDSGQAGWIKYLGVDATQIYFTDISKVYALAK